MTPAQDVWLLLVAPLARRSRVPSCSRLGCRTQNSPASAGEGRPLLPNAVARPLEQTWIALRAEESAASEDCQLKKNRFSAFLLVKAKCVDGALFRSGASLLLLRHPRHMLQDFFFFLLL
jgi:hypothetical protein